MIRRGAAASVAVAALLGCAGGGGEDAEPGTTATTAAATTAASSTTTTTVAGLADGRPYEVATESLPADDPDRPLPLLVLVPDGDGPFPVVVFSHGWTANGPVYEPFLRRIADDGYVVVAPTFPFSSGPTGQVGAYDDQPADVYAALERVLDAQGNTVDADRIALAGHSLGAITTIGATYNSCCADDRVDAAVALAGVEAPFGTGEYRDRPPTPLLLVHGDADRTVPVSSSDDLYARATGPAAFLRFPAGGHSDILFADAGPLTADAIVAWLDRWLLDDASAWEALAGAVAASGVATLTERG